MEISKNGHTFYVTGDFSYNFFKNNKLDVGNRDIAILKIINKNSYI